MLGLKDPAMAEAIEIGAHEGEIRVDEVITAEGAYVDASVMLKPAPVQILRDAADLHGQNPGEIIGLFAAGFLQPEIMPITSHDPAGLRAADALPPLLMPGGAVDLDDAHALSAFLLA